MIAFWQLDLYVGKIEKRLQKCIRMSPVVNQRCKEDGNPEYKGYSLGQAGTKIVEKTTKWYIMA